MNAKVLIVDAATADHTVVEQYVSESEGVCLRVDTSAQVLRLVRGERPDVIVLDLDLPGVDGLSMVRQLKADPFTRDVPIVLASHAWRESDRAWATLLGVESYLTKPYRRAEVAASLGARLNS